MSRPLVSVVIAAYNAAEYLAETLASATTQTWPNLEIILVDDGSTDDTARVAATFAPRVRYEPRSHGGLAAARNEGIRLARGDYIALLDADDLWHPEKIAIQVAIGERHPQSGMIAGDGEEFEGDRILQPFLFHGAAAAVGAAPGGQMTGDLQRALIDGPMIACPAQVLFPRHVIDRIGLFIGSGAQDYDYYLRVSLHYPVTLHADVLTRWRYRPDSMSGPRTGRILRWACYALPVLLAHRGRCRPEDRRTLARRIRRQVRSLGELLMADGRATGRLPATRRLLKLLAQHPSSSALLVQLVGLWAPGPIYARAWSLGRAASQRRFGKVERRSPALDRLVPRNVRVERIASGFRYTEGPVWMRGGHLLFGDLPNNVIWRWDPAGGASVVRRRSGYADADRPPGGSMGSNGMTLDDEGRLTVCEPGNRRVTRIEADGLLTVLAHRYEGKRLNSPNDLVYRRSDGSLYFTDPPHGLLREDADPGKELSVNGIYRLANGALQLVGSEMTRPNGLAFSPDERHLYVSNSDSRRKIWMRYAVEADGSLSDGVVFLDLSAEGGHVPDGLKVDVDGNLYLTGPGGVWIVSPAAKILGRIRTRQEPANLAWGGNDRRTLFLTAPNEVYRIELLARGTW